MKNFHLFFAAIAIAIVAVLAPVSAAAAPKSQKASTSLASKIPANLIVEQKATLNDGRSVTVYYKKIDGRCEIYSPDNLKGYVADDLLALNSTSFRIASDVKGKLVYSCPISKARSFVKRMVNTYL